MQIQILAHLLAHSNLRFNPKTYFQFCQLRESTLDRDLLNFEDLRRFWEGVTELKRHQVLDLLRKDLADGIITSTPQSNDFPQEFIHLNPPVWFFQYQGTPLWLQKRGLAIVGSREPSYDTLLWMEEVLPEVVSELDLFIVSGGARGVDQKAHSIALRMGVGTLVALPSGIQNLYPQILVSMRDYVCQSGSVFISEYPSQTAMNKSHFAARNRLIPALSVATLVLEAREKSGTLITARHSADQAKPLFILPSHPYDAKARGGLNLICEGATPVRDAADLKCLLRAELKTQGLVQNHYPCP